MVFVLWELRGREVWEVKAKREREDKSAAIRKGRRQGKTGSVANKRKEESHIGDFSSVGEKNG